MDFTIDENHQFKTIFRPKERRLDSRNAGELKAEFLLLAQSEINSLIVDFTEVDQVDSAVLSALLLGQRQMRIVDGELRLAGLNDSIRKLLELTQLDRMFPIYDSVEEAIQSRRKFFLDPEFPEETEYYEYDRDADEPEEPGFQMLTKSPATNFDRKEEKRLEAGIHNHTFNHTEPLGPEAPSAQDIRLGAIAAGGSFGAAALTNIMMTPETPLELEDMSLLHADLGEDEDEEEDHDLDDIDDLEQDFSDEEDEDDEDEDDDDDDDLDDLDEEDDAEDSDDDAEEDTPETEEPEELDEDFEDDDWDEEELEEDEEEDY